LEMSASAPDSATIARLRAELRLTIRSCAVRHYVWGVVRGDLGRSYITRGPSPRPATLPKTAQLGLAAMVFAALSGITLGPSRPAAAGRRGRPVRDAALLPRACVPVYWVGSPHPAVRVGLGGCRPRDREGWRISSSRFTLGCDRRLSARMTRGANAGRAVERLHPDRAGEGLSELAVVGRHAFRNALIPRDHRARVDVGNYLTAAC